jgi:hypothetical protein
VFTYPQRFDGFNATLSTFFCDAFGCNFHEVRAITLTLRFEHIGEDVPRSRCGVAAVARRFQHPFHVEVFDSHQVVLPSIVVREFVQEITPLAQNVVLLEEGGLAPAIS